MKVCFLVFSCIFLSFSARAQALNYREVILFYSANHVDTATKQFKILSYDVSELSSRQIKITRVATKSEAFSSYKSLKINPNLFTLVLIGKDGGIKYSSNKIISSAKLYVLIDQMPMRQQEMKKNE